jgi:hypothetical protein
MDISMPRDFPANDFRAFGLAARNFFPKILSDEALNDPLERLRHFTWAWQAVRYRYRLSFECSEEFRSLIVNARESWRKGDVDAIGLPTAPTRKLTLVRASIWAPLEGPPVETNISTSCSPTRQNRD